MWATLCACFDELNPRIIRALVYAEAKVGVHSRCTVHCVHRRLLTTDARLCGEGRSRPSRQKSWT